jgi:hypothetical protein
MSLLYMPMVFSLYKVAIFKCGVCIDAWRFQYKDRRKDSFCCCTVVVTMHLTRVVQRCEATARGLSGSEVKKTRRVQCGTKEDVLLLMKARHGTVCISG